MLLLRLNPIEPPWCGRGDTGSVHGQALQAASVQRIIGGVEVENDLLWRLLVRLQKQIDKQWTCPILVERHCFIQRRLFRTEPGS